MTDSDYAKILIPGFDAGAMENPGSASSDDSGSSFALGEMDAIAEAAPYETPCRVPFPAPYGFSNGAFDALESLSDRVAVLYGQSHNHEAGA